MAGILFSLVSPIDRTPLQDQVFYNKMMQQVDQLKFDQPKKGSIRSGWKKISITPDYPMPMAGYRMRNDFETVHDTLFARIIVLQVGVSTIYMVSVDLLLFPPALKLKLQKHFKESSNQSFLYLSATHTHNGVGCWHDSAVGNMVLGNYNKPWVEQTKNKIIHAIEDIEHDMKTSSIAYWQTDAMEYASNRLEPQAPYDGLMRGIKLTRSDSTTAHLITYSAHATSISKKSKSLSGDYPAALTDSLMNSSNSFGVFMAGMVGSHRLAGINELDFELVSTAGKALSDKIKNAQVLPERDSVELKTGHIKIQFGPSQLRISKNWKLRNWVFSWLVNPLEGELTYLQLNDIVFIGTPCDFSGEIFARHIAPIATRQNKKVIITSFNGDYVGYVTEDEHYETLAKEEVMTMNWVGPYHGRYFSDMINTVLEKQ